MNILPHKSWHVRTKKNIARVRRDEAKAKEEEKAQLERVELAEKEARIDALRQIARGKYGGFKPPKDDEDEVATSDKNQGEDALPLEHVNFFKELEQGEVSMKGTNAEHEREKKEEREKYEKQIGYLTYLGQDTVESTGNVSWFNKVPDRLRVKPEDPEVQTDKKAMYDPLGKINFYMKRKPEVVLDKKKDVADDKDKKSKKKKKKHKRKRSRSLTPPPEIPKGPSIEELRAKRLKRENEEKLRAGRLLAKLKGEPIPEEKPAVAPIKQKYNSQFNPHLAKQNRED